jgi:hypothetical protein
MRSDGSLFVQLYQQRNEAYQACLPNNDVFWHTKIYNEVFQRIDNGNSLVLVSYNDHINIINNNFFVYEARWIEFVPNPNVYIPFPALLLPQALHE